MNQRQIGGQNVLPRDPWGWRDVVKEAPGSAQIYIHWRLGDSVLMRKSMLSDGRRAYAHTKRARDPDRSTIESTRVMWLVYLLGGEVEEIIGEGH